MWLLKNRFNFQSRLLGASAQLARYNGALHLLARGHLNLVLMFLKNLTTEAPESCAAGKAEVIEITKEITMTLL